MIKRRLLKGTCGVLLSLLMTFSSVGESLGGLVVMAAGEEADTERDEEDGADFSYGDGSVSADDMTDEEADDASEDADTSDEELLEDETISENDSEDNDEIPGTEESGEDPSAPENSITGGGSEEDGEDKEVYPYMSPDDDPAYKENDVWISAINDTAIVYDGTEHKPHPFIFYDMEMLKEGRDYTLSWKNSVKAYSCDNKEKPTEDDFNKGPQVIITMKGSYSGTTMVFYDITPRDISTGEFESTETTLIYTGSKQDYTPDLIWKGKILKYNTDFVFDVYDKENDEYRAFTDAELTGDASADSNYFVRISGIGNFKGDKYTGLNIVHIDKAVNVSELTVSAIPVQQFTGEPVTADKLTKKGKPYEVIVTYGKTQLVQGTDYAIHATAEAVFPGTYNLLIEGLKTPGSGGYVFVGEKTVQFTIEGSLKKAAVGGVAASYDVKPADEYVRPDEDQLVVSLNGKEIPKEYYSISYKKDNKAGTASLTVSGKNGFKGKKTVKYKINARSIENLEVTVSAAFYAKSGAKPSVVVDDEGEFLRNGVNYTLSYKNNKKIGGKKQPSVTVKGKGLYKGKKTAYFTIKAAEIDFEKGYELIVQDKVCSPKAGAYKTKIIFTDPDGKKLKEGTDYDVVYKNASGDVLTKDYTASNGEVITVEINSKGAYTADTFVETYRIIQKGMDIAKASVSIAAQDYYEDYSGVRLPLDDTTIKVMLGKTRLPRVSSGEYVDKEKYSGDVNGFEIVPDSYRNNKKSGTATVLIRGVGIYGGVKKAKFEIKPKKVKGIDPSKYIPVPEKHLTVTDFGAVPGDGVDDTSAIMAAINAASKDSGNEHNLYFPAGRYNIGGAGNINIGVPDVHITMDADAELYVAPQGDGYNIILIHENNISIRGGKLLGERFRHSGGPTGQYGMGITITDGKNITIRDMVICNNRGDGIYINDNGNKTVSNVTIKGCDIYDNARNNICVIRGDHITIENCRIYHKEDGHSPMAGIDLEPDMKVGQVKDNKKVKHVIIRDCKIETYKHYGAHQQGNGLWAYYGVMIIYGFGEPVVEDVLIENCDIYGDLSKGSSKGLVIKNTTVHGEILDGDT